jgi:hypothetical protein
LYIILIMQFLDKIILFVTHLCHLNGLAHYIFFTLEILFTNIKEINSTTPRDTAFVLNELQDKIASSSQVVN